jgi:Family of unknown function (DUF6534)
MVHGALGFQATADIVITTCMCLLLRRRRTGFQKCVCLHALNESLGLINDLTLVAWHRTDSVINRMVLYTIGTGLITSVLSCFLVVMVHFLLLVNLIIMALT